MLRVLMVLVVGLGAWAALAQDASPGVPDAFTFGLSDLVKTGPVGIIAAAEFYVIRLLDKRLETERAARAELMRMALDAIAKNTDALSWFARPVVTPARGVEAPPR